MITARTVIVLDLDQDWQSFILLVNERPLVSQKAFFGRIEKRQIDYKTGI